LPGSGLDLVNASCLQPSRNGKLFFYGKSDARRLLAITERRVVDDDGGRTCDTVVLSSRNI